MTKQIEALKLAEEALHNYKQYGDVMLVNYGQITPYERGEEALAAIRDALANHVEQNLTMVAPEGYALIAIDALKVWGKYDVVRNACKFSAEPVKQEPVAILKSSKANFERQFGKQVFADWIYDDLTYSFENAAPVDAKAIRAEALEEAEEIAKTIGGSFAVEFAAAIRGLK